MMPQTLLTVLHKTIVPLVLPAILLLLWYGSTIVLCLYLGI